jgi:hypothetical protein
MGRGDVPTRGSDWSVNLEICVGVIYCKGWFRVALGQRDWCYMKCLFN